jgi:signal transduction histidine kinase
LHNERSQNSLLTESSLDRLALLGRLHETLAQDLACLGYDMDALIGESELDSTLRGQLRAIRLSLQEITQQFRDDIYLTNQRSRQWLHNALKEALHGFNLSIDLSYPTLIGRYEHLLNEAIFEIARNSLRHSSARKFEIAYCLDQNHLQLKVSDDGTGFSDASTPNLGLQLIDQTLTLVAVAYTCESNSHGTTYTITIDRRLLEHRSAS